MRRALGAGALVLTAVLLPVAPAQADDAVLPEGFVCTKDAVPSTVTDDGPAAKKDKNGNGYVCVYTNPKNGKWRFIDDTFVGV